MLIARLLATGDVFVKRVALYLTEFFTKGVPSCFVDLKPLYTDATKRQQIEDLVISYRRNIENTGFLDGSTSDASSTEMDAPSTFVWVMYYLAQHYSSQSQHSEALDCINQIMHHTPTLPDLYHTKARILKRAGDYIGAEIELAKARELDGQDRYLNGKHIKYLLRVDKIQQAEDVAGLFTRVRCVLYESDLPLTAFGS